MWFALNFMSSRRYNISVVFTGHAMFSHKDLPLEAETLEYGWLIELTVGDLRVITELSILSVQSI